METFLEAISQVNDVIWHKSVLYVVLGVGVLFTILTKFGQVRALTHGTAVTLGRYDDKDDPGAINHFQALSAALSATVGLGNIGGVAVAIALGGPGAVFWMWIIGIAGMAIKTTEVTLSMIYRNTDKPDNPHGGPMYVAQKAFKQWGLGPIGQAVGFIFCVTLLVSAVTGGNMFQAWNVGEVTENAIGMPSQAVGIILAVLVGMVIIGGIKRIGAVAGRLVPIMCVLYLLAATYVILINIAIIPDMLILIVTRAFTPTEAGGAFIGGTVATAFLWGMKRALFSSEAGQGSSPIAHSAAKTSEPVREAVVAGLEPFIDTIVVCTLTALVILSTGAWNRGGEANFDLPVAFVSSGQNEDGMAEWIPETNSVPPRTRASLRVNNGRNWGGGDHVFVIATWRESADMEATTRGRVGGEIVEDPDSGDLHIEWDAVAAVESPRMIDTDLYQEYPGATLTTYAFDSVTPGLGTWLVLIASWMFAVSTMISWSYYGEQGIVFMFGEKGVLPYKLVYCGLAIVATLGFMETDDELDTLTSLGTGVMLWANIPIMLIFGGIAMRAYHEYMRKLDAGDFHPHERPPITDVFDGSDVE